MDELLPCPFCGGKARLHKKAEEDGTFYGIGCGDDETVCILWVPKNADDIEKLAYYCMAYPKKERAIKAWNTRQESARQATDKERDKIVGMLRENGVNIWADLIENRK